VAHNRLVFLAAPGVGRERNLTVSIVSAAAREQAKARDLIRQAAGAVAAVG
jgi:hypothetical protein